MFLSVFLSGFAVDSVDFDRREKDALRCARMSGLVWQIASI